MSSQEIDEYFAEIGAWMKNDIKREIELARVSQAQEGVDALARLGVPGGGGNLLAALGLVAYTEALGLLRVWNTTNRGYGTPSECFNAFFDRMAGGSYKTWWSSWSRGSGKSVYDVLRNGLVHEYRPKVDSGFWIATGDELGLGEADGVLIFKVAPYYRHFCAEMDVLHAELAALPNATVPPPSGSRLGGSGQGFGPTSTTASSGVSGPTPSVSPTSAPE
jgi:hypothetical protein